jgi:hypothetical protein
MADEIAIRAFERNETIRFLGSLIGTEGISPENNELANKYLNKLLKANESYIDKLSSSLDLETKIQL